MFFGSGRSELNSKWNINDFVIGNGNRSRKNSGDSKDEYELGNIIKKIESSFSRGGSELDSILKEIKNKRKEIRTRFKVLENDPENEATFHKLDVDLLLSQVKIAESKVKMASDKYKQIRDEKKLLMDKTPKNDAPSVVVQNQQNSPLANIAPAQEQRIFRTVGSLNTENIVETKSRFVDEAETIEHSNVHTEIPCKTGADGGSIAPTSKQQPVVTKMTMDGRVMETTDDVLNKRKQIILERLNNEDKIFDKMKSTQGIDYKRSIASIVNKTKDLSKKMFVNPNNGTFFVRTFENVDGVEVPCTTETFDSIMHIGIPEFNFRNKTVKTQYEDESIPYEIVDDNSSMPEFYMDSWRDPSLRRFIIPEEKRELLY